jgi:hypothetical protein
MTDLVDGISVVYRILKKLIPTKDSITQIQENRAVNDINRQKPMQIRRHNPSSQKMV